MFDLREEWSISFAGCGFMGIYYVGASSCVLERFPCLIQNASKIYGASAGALMAAVLCVGIPLEKCCADLMFMAKEARKRKLGPLHPSYNLLQIVKDSMLGSLPEDAHVRASGRLCVSLTRVSDGKNVLVSEFDSREELMQVLVCSCFVPFYCGVIPPTYRGVHYVDGAVSDNLPRCHLRNTVTFSAYAGESDVCPRASTLSLHEVRFNNVSIQVNTENAYRVTSTFFPPEPEVMAEISQNGYMDALRFLQENNLISPERHLSSVGTDAPKPVCCELAKQTAKAGVSTGGAVRCGPEILEDEHWWLDRQLIDKLPVNIKKALCEACKEARAAGGLLSQVTELLPHNVTSYLRIPSARSVGSACSLAQRLVDLIPDVPRDMSWFYGVAGGIYKKAWRDSAGDCGGEPVLHRRSSLPSGLDLWNNSDENSLSLTPQAPPTSSLTITCRSHDESRYAPLTPPPTPTFSPDCGGASGGSPWSAASSWGSGLGRAVGWIRTVTSEQDANIKRSGDFTCFPAFK
ncbi:patatin-like phospholipase domain-containing protein 2 [Aulostomus maculatus]